MDGTGKATTVVRIFESYGWKDASDIAGRLRDSLQQAGYEVWIDREHLRADDKHFSIALEQAVVDSEVVIALLSPHSVRGLGAHDDRASICYNEIRLAEELARPIVPVRVQRFTGAAPLLIIKYRILDWLDWQDPDRYQNGLAEVLAAVEAAEARELILDREISLQTSNFASQLRTAADDFTGRGWLFDGLAQWLDGAPRCLRLEGVTGTGKTAVVAELVRRNPGGRLLAFHFCTPLQLGAVGFVRSLAGMLAASIDEYADLLNSGRLAHQLNSSDPSTMLLDGVLEPLRMVPVDGRYFIAVDALDEAIGADAQMSIPVLLAQHVDDFPPWLKLMITCRPQQRVQGLFGTAEVWSLDDDTAQRADLSSYLQRRLVDPEVKQRIEDRAAGNFQYASTVLDALAAGEIDAAELDALPRRLEVFYYRRAVQRFPTAAAYRPARTVLEVLAAARGGLTAAQLAAVTGLGVDELPSVLDAVGCFAAAPSGVWRIVHQSIADWLISQDAKEFRIEVAAGRDRLLAFCRKWKSNRDPYALTHVVTHLLDAGHVDDAAAVIRDGLFELRKDVVGEPRLDGEDTRALTAALIAARDQARIVALARTANTWQRDGVASAMVAAPVESAGFIDDVVGELLTVSA